MPEEIQEVSETHVEQTVEAEPEVSVESEPVPVTEESTERIVEAAPAPVPRKRRKRTVKVPEPPQEKHCPACMNGESLEEGEGTHILLTVEHPYEPPEIFKDAEASVVAPTKRPEKARPMAKELRLASSFAEKNLPKKIAHKAKLLGELAQCEAEIQEYVRVIQALSGKPPVGLQNVPYLPTNPPYTPPSPAQPAMAPLYPAYQQSAPVMPDVTPPKPMAAGGAGVAQGMLSVPPHWYEA